MSACPSSWLALWTLQWPLVTSLYVVEHSETRLITPSAQLSMFPLYPDLAVMSPTRPRSTSHQLDFRLVGQTHTWKRYGGGKDGYPLSRLCNRVDQPTQLPAPKHFMSTGPIFPPPFFLPG